MVGRDDDESLSSWGLRRAPTQERARRTFERILDAAADVLENEGLVALNTNAVAARANMTAPAVYRYFKNKEAILVALGERYLDAEQAWTTGLEDIADPATPLDALVASLVGAYFEAAHTYPAIGALRTAMQAIPELRELDDRSLAVSSRRLARALRARAPSRDAGSCATAARLVVETVCHGVDRSLGCAGGEKKRRRMELERLVTAYLTAFAHDGRSRPRGRAPSKRRGRRTGLP